ncbi:hypothetical protein Hanom_Chr16g01466721 [Helianthus anomalus]
MGPKDKVQDEAPPTDAYVANALYAKLCGHPFVCIVIPDGAPVMAGMSLLWREWILFDFVDPPRHAALKAEDRVLGKQEPDVLKIHLEQFCCQLGGGNVVAIEKKSVRVRITGRKYMAAGTGASSFSVTAPAGSVAELASPTNVSKKRKTVPALTAFEEMQAAYALPLGK